jgi:hypothetical protein
MSVRHVESTVRTNKLKCTDCGRKINRGEDAVFELDDCKHKPMQAVFCLPGCGAAYEQQVIDDEQHPFDLD